MSAVKLVLVLLLLKTVFFTISGLYVTDTLVVLLQLFQISHLFLVRAERD